MPHKPRFLLTVVLSVLASHEAVAANTCSSTLSTTVTSCVQDTGGIEISANGVITGGAIPAAVTGLSITSTSGTVLNYGTIGGTNGSVSFRRAGTFTFVNELNGIIYGNYPFSIDDNRTFTGSITNLGHIYRDGINGYGGTLYIGGAVTGGIVNSGSILSDATVNPTATWTSNGGGSASKIIGDTSGIQINTVAITGGIFNSGTIVDINPTHNSYGIDNYGTVDFITNTGTISGSSFGIHNVGTIQRLDNSQGAGNVNGPLTYTGVLPVHYNITINSTSEFGRLSVNSGTGSMAFGIYTGSPVANNTRYTNVLQGLQGALGGSTITGSGFTITGATGTYSGFSYTLDRNGLANLGNWDLVFGSVSSGPSSTDTQAALTRTASRLRSAYNKASQSSNFPTSNTYDCNLFDARGMCVSAGGRYTSAENPHSHSTAAVLVLGYKVSDNLRIGGFLDQSIDNSAPAGIQISNKNPMMGAFVYWNQNADGLGYQVKLANTYQDKDITLTRDVIGTSESGTGKTGLTTESYVGELSYAFAYQDKTILRPYLGLRYTSIEQDGYTETGVTTPLTYSALKDETTAALIGVKFKHQLTEKATLTGSLGIEQDLHHKAGNFIATGVSGLTAENFSGDLHRTRGLASLGAYYAVAKSQRISGEVMLQELPFQNSLGATAYVNYMIGF